MESIDNRTRKRAVKSFHCFPFNLRFYSDVKLTGLNAERVFDNQKEYLKEGTSWFRHPNDVEAAFRWMIKIGVLRREVDGQGLTAKIRLAPLARQMLEQDPGLPFQKASFYERISQWANRNWFLR